MHIKTTTQRLSPSIYTYIDQNTFDFEMTSKLMYLVGIDIRFGMQSVLHRKFSGRDKLLDATPSNEVKDHREKLPMVMDSSVQIEIMA